MANTVKMKQSAVAGKVPTTAQLALGELAINTVDGKLYLKKNVSGTETIVDVTAAAAGLTPATATVLGGVKDGAGVSIATDGTLSADVTSVAGRTGAVTLAVADVSGAAPLASPTFTGTPAAPTAAQGTSTTQVATTAFVNAEIAADAAPIGHVGATGTAHGAATTAVAGFMSASDKSKLDGIAAGAQVNAVTSVAGRTGAVTLAVADVSGAAPLASPGLTGTPTAPTAAQGTNTTQLATTAFVQAEITADAVTKTSSTGAALMPVGTTAQRPASPSSGMYRMNSTTGEPEWYDGSSATWKPFYSGSVYDIEYLVVGGGGGGAGTYATGGGGGGGGGHVNGYSQVVRYSAYAVTVGAGGAGSAQPNNGGNGGASTFSSISVLGGGGGGCYNGPKDGSSGASGGGGGGGYSAAGSVSVAAGGSGTSGQGNAGGSGRSTNASGDSAHAGGGGGGFSSAGGNATDSSGGNGGSPVSNAITGTSVARCGGGGGGKRNTGTAGAGGGGGAGNGGLAADGASASANTGSGGGGAGSGDGVNKTGGNGGSGVVIIKYLGAQKGTGGTVTSVGGYTIHTFTSSGTFTA